MKYRILYLVAEDWYFCSHRLPLAAAARAAGYEVWVATRVNHDAERIRAAGFQLVPINLERSSLSLWHQVRALAELVRVYRRLQPDLVHHVALKPVLLGSLAARWVRLPAVVNALAGLGYVFASEQWRARMLRPVVRLAFRRVLCLGRSRLILQNPDDIHLFLHQRLIPADRIVLIRGSGVDVAHFTVLPEPKGTATVALVARMLWDKGIRELVEAARLLRRQGRAVRVILAGGLDSLNPSCVPEQEILAWQREGVVEWWGEVEDVRMVWAQAHVAVLPSYREGLPKSLLEAAACGRAMIATDVPGCREIVRHGETGLLVPPREAPGLAAALWELLQDADKRRQMAGHARRLVEQEFTQERVVAETLRVYAELLNPRQAPQPVPDPLETSLVP